MCQKITLRPLLKLENELRDSANMKFVIGLTEALI